MANTSIVTDDEYLSPDEFTSEERDLKSKVEELSNQNGSLQRDNAELHKYINEMSVKLSDYATLENKIICLTAENNYLNNRLNTGDMEYVKLWKEVFPAKKDSQATTTDKHVPNPDGLKTTEKERTDQDRLEELENAVRTFMAKLKEESTNKEKLKKRLDQVREEKNGLNEDTSRKIAEYQNKTLKAEENLKCMTAKYSVSEKEKEELNKKVSEQTQTYEKTKEKLKVMIAKYADMEKLQPEDAMKREELLQEYKKQVEEKGIAMGKLNQQVGTLQTELEKSEEQFKTLKAKHDKLVKTSAGMKDEKTLLQKRQSQLQKENEAVIAEKDHIKDELQGQLSDFKGELILLAEEKSRLRLEYEAKLAAKVQEVATLRGELEKSDAECKQKQEDNVDLTKQLKEKKDSEVVTEENSRLRLEYEAKLAAKVQEVATLRGQLERSDAEYKQKQEDNLDLTKQLKEKKDSEVVTEENSRLRLEYEAKPAAKVQEVATLRGQLDTITEKHCAMTLRMEKLEILLLLQEQENMKAATEIEQPVKDSEVQEKETLSKDQNQITATEDGEQHGKDSEVQPTETLPKDQKLITDAEILSAEMENENTEKLQRVAKNSKDDNAEKFQSLRVENNQLRMELQKLLQERQEPTACIGNELGINSGSLVAEKLSKTKKIIELRIRSVRSGMGKTMIDIVTKGLQNLLKDRLIREKVDLHIKPCQTVEADAEGPLFVLCLAKAIIGTKVNALEGIPGNKDTALIVIHYNETEEPLSLTNIGFRSYGAELRQLGGTIDMAFSGNNGLYECDINNSAVERMTTFLKKF